MSLKKIVVLTTLGILFQGVISLQKDLPPPFAQWKQRAERTGIACESHKLFLKCPNRSEKLLIYNTFYGRQEEGICQHQILPYKGECAEDEELINRKIMQLCSNENKCSVAASRDFLLQNGKEKCPHLYKYLSIKYKCVQTPHIYKKCFHKKCLTPAKCWPKCSKDCCEPPPPPPPKYLEEELAMLRNQWSAGGYNPEFPQYQQNNEKRYNIPGTYLYGMRNSAQSPGYARSRLNYPQVQRKYGYYKARSQIPTYVQTSQQITGNRKSSVPAVSYNTQRLPVQYQASLAQQRGSIPKTWYKAATYNPSTNQYFNNNAATRSQIQYPDRYQQYSNYLKSLQQVQPQQ